MNPIRQEDLPQRVRVACVQYAMRAVAGWDEFAEQVRRNVAIAAGYGADFVLFPELFTLQFLSAEPSMLPGAAAMDELTARTPMLRALFADMATTYRINVIGGTHLSRNDEGELRNVCMIALRDGSVHEREKIHATPNERDAWNVSGGNRADVVHTDCGPIGIAICYDSEFPELTRHLVAQGASIVFVPFCTDDRHGYLRVRYSAQARAVENQIYVVLAGGVGLLPGVFNLDAHYAQSAILTPCDLPFARDGVAVEASANVETVVVADLDLRVLHTARAAGTVRNLADRREDLYEVVWKGK